MDSDYPFGIFKLFLGCPTKVRIISELQAIKTTWGEAKRKAQDRTRWKKICGFPMSPMG
jgi:hypothetical protein